MNDTTTSVARADAQRPAATSTRTTEAEQRSVQPAVDVFEDESGITLLADLPGVPKEQLELRVDGDSLLIEGNAEPQAPEGLEPLWAEVQVARYRRHFTLSRELDTSRVEANLKDGVLTLRIPKAAHAQARRIEVHAD